MAVKRNTEGLQQSAKQKRQEAFEKVEKGIQQLVKDKKRINFNTVAEASGVSKAWLYKEATVKERIEYLRSQCVGTKKLPPKQRASSDSQAAMIKTLKERIRKLEAENRDLRRQNEVACGQMLKVRELERQVERLEAEKKRIEPLPIGAKDTIQDRLKNLGVSMNTTLERAIAETPEGIVETAIDTLTEAIQNGRAHNPAGFLYKAITDAWRPNGEGHQQVEEMEDFNQWWKTAYAQGLVLASTRIEGELHVLNKGGEWIPFKEARKRN